MSFFSSIIDTVIGVAKSVGKVKVTDILKTVLFAIPKIVTDVGTIVDSDIKQKIDAFWDDFDRLTGSDPGAFDLLSNMPAEVEEETCDALKVLGRNLMYNQAKIDGYYIPGTENADADLNGPNMIAGFIEKALSTTGQVTASLETLGVSPSTVVLDESPKAAYLRALDLHAVKPGNYKKDEQIRLIREVCTYLLKVGNDAGN